MGSSVSEPPAAPVPPLDAALPLPFLLDFSCPLPLATKPARILFGTQWAYPVAGPSSVNEELGVFVKRRYLETLYLGETLSPISGLIDDLHRVAASHNDAVDPHIAALLLPLHDIEARHRRTLLPVLSASMAVVETNGRIDSQAEAAGLSAEERDVLASAVHMRMTCRAVADAERGLPVKALGEEFERREVLIQLVLLLFYRGRNGKQEKKRRKSKPKNVLDDTDTSLELLADRIGVWLAVAELGIGEYSSSNDERNIALVLKGFWERALLPFLPREQKYLADFHAKVFGTPIPQDLIPQKKPRKPKITHKLSVDEMAPKRRKARERSPLAEADLEPEPTIKRSLSRSLSRTITRTISRSTSRPDAHARPANATKRVPSARDIPPLRRSSSLITRNLSTARSGSGLLGRKSAGENLRRIESQSILESESQARAETLIHATPSKPKYSYGTSYGGPQSYGNSYGGPSYGNSYNPFGSRTFSHPTPIREEPSSAASRRSYVGDTPRGSYVTDTPVRGRALETSDDLGELMVPTDDEDDGQDESQVCIPETPRKSRP